MSDIIILILDFKNNYINNILDKNIHYNEHIL